MAFRGSLHLGPGAGGRLEADLESPTRQSTSQKQEVLLGTYEDG